MTNADIRKECEQMYAVIKSARDRLNELCATCKHEKTSICDYSWAPGHSMPDRVCEYCGECVAFTRNSAITTQH